MRKVLLAAAIAVLGLAVAMNASAYTKQSARFDAQGVPYGLAVDCTLDSHNFCSNWIWVFNDVEGAVWGSVLSSADCGPCENGGAVTAITLYGRCSTVPGAFGGVGISAVDGVGCRTTLLYDSGPLTMTHCVVGDRWSVYDLSSAPVHTHGEPFAVTITWGAQSGGANNPQFSTDNGIANLYCMQNPGVYPVFPGCGGSTSDCTAWTVPTQKTYIYVTDFNGDGFLDDICAIYGGPYPLAFPYIYPYGYLPNNLIVSVGLDCRSPTATEAGSWGHVKSLYQ